MPQPLKVGSTVQLGPNKVLDRPDLAAEIGNVCANWSLVESELMTLYALLMGDYLPKRPGFAPPTHPIAYQVFDSLNAFGPRVELLEKLLAWRTSEATQKYFREVIRPQLRKRFTERSIIAHGVWGTCDDYPDALILVPTYGHQMIYKKRDFEHVSHRIHEARKTLGELVARVYERRKQGI
jgi:hypothetical protein